MPAPRNNGKKPAAKSAPKRSAKTAGAPVKVDTIKHTESSRTNIPTRQLQAMASEHEEKPVTLRYPRDTSLDPQLVWKGKDEQDASDLEVTAAPIYIQEKVHPQALIANIREQASAGKPPPADLFSDFNGLDEAVKTDYYKHAQHWTNRTSTRHSLMPGRSSGSCSTATALTRRTGSAATSPARRAITLRWSRRPASIRCRRSRPWSSCCASPWRARLG